MLKSYVEAVPLDGSYIRPKGETLADAVFNLFVEYNHGLHVVLVNGSPRGQHCGLVKRTLPSDVAAALAVVIHVARHVTKIHSYPENRTNGINNSPDRISRQNPSHSKLVTTTLNK
jgi:hypothetical protein